MNKGHRENRGLELGHQRLAFGDTAPGGGPSDTAPGRGPSSARGNEKHTEPNDRPSGHRQEGPRGVSGNKKHVEGPSRHERRLSGHYNFPADTTNKVFEGIGGSNFGIKDWPSSHCAEGRSRRILGRLPSGVRLEGLELGLGLGLGSEFEALELGLGLGLGSRFGLELGHEFREATEKIKGSNLSTNDRPSGHCAEDPSDTAPGRGPSSARGNETHAEPDDRPSGHRQDGPRGVRGNEKHTESKD